MRRILTCAMLAVAGLALSPAAMAKGPRCAADAVETRHQAVIGGQKLSYIACAGTLPVRAPDGSTGKVFYTAYLAAGGSKRPLTFVWNGGPGADSRLLHFHALGPRVLRGGKLVDNEASPLGASDLVFVDPIGTSFSRADDPAKAASFYGTVADIASISGFVRDFRTRYGRTASPLFLAGESFGTWRAAGVAEALVDAQVPVAGIALISGGIPLGDLPDRNLMRALSLPNRTATAQALGRLDPELQAMGKGALDAAAHWAERNYAPALANPDGLSPEQRAAVIAELARFQGLDPATIDAKTLWVSPRAFRTGLLTKEGKTLGIFDMRQTAPAGDDKAEGAIVLDYYRNALGWRTGGYAGIDAPDGEVGNDWQYDQAPITKESLARAMAGEGPPSPSQPWTLHAMQKAPALRTWVAAGIYDSLNSCEANKATVAALPTDVARRFVLDCYAGGHMMYEDPAESIRFGKDLTAFLRGGA